MQEDIVVQSPTVDAAMGGASMRDAVFAGMNPQHPVVAGLGAQPKDSMGVPWNGTFIAAGGNVLASPTAVASPAATPIGLYPCRFQATPTT